VPELSATKSVSIGDSRMGTPTIKPTGAQLDALKAWIKLRRKDANHGKVGSDIKSELAKIDPRLATADRFWLLTAMMQLSSHDGPEAEDICWKVYYALGGER